MKLQDYIELLQDSLSRMPDAEVYTGYKDYSENWDSNRITIEENPTENEVRVYGIPTGYIPDYESEDFDPEDCRDFSKVFVGIAAGIVGLIAVMSIMSLL